MSEEGRPLEILTKDLSSGQLHRRYAGKSGKFYSIEADNLDSAGEWEPITQAEFDAADDKLKCRNCFGDLHQDGQVG